MSEGAWLGRMAAAARAIQSNPDIAIRITLEGAAFIERKDTLDVQQCVESTEQPARAAAGMPMAAKPSEKTSRTTAMPPGLAPRTHRPTGTHRQGKEVQAQCRATPAPAARDAAGASRAARATPGALEARGTSIRIEPGEPRHVRGGRC